ncbi:hypothetical protein B0J14DRAFT_612035 [Halenospora varia]|nr:hypothetical protein B0J14DRAFT_612035 [Halenospora varia]
MHVTVSYATFTFFYSLLFLLPFLPFLFFPIPLPQLPIPSSSSFCGARTSSPCIQHLQFHSSLFASRPLFPGLQHQA